MPELAPNPPLDLESLRAYCEAVSFRSREVLRRKGQHYRHMYLITHGEVEVDRYDPGGSVVSVGAGYPVGEISFLRGCPATATVTTKTDTEALILDDSTLARLDSQQPGLTARFLQVLAEIAEDRMNDNLVMASPSSVYGKASGTEVLLCRGKTMEESAKRLRYEVYCQELGRDSPFADHVTKTLADRLDDFGYIFIAVDAGEVIGTLRLNLCREGSVGALGDLYGMTMSEHHPRATAICTKFIVRKSRRRSPAAVKLLGAGARLALENRIIEAYIDTIPALLPYYKAIGFRISGPKFLHRENGPSYPMKGDVRKHGPKISKELGTFPYLTLYVKSQMIKWSDKLRGDRAFAVDIDGRSAP